jgi:NADP-dependent aldehyde dehydrogenase
LPLAFSVSGGDTASALAAGCPVIVKAHPAHPATSELVAGAIASAVKKAGLPAGWFSMLHGRSPEVSLALVRHPLAKAVGFTGSLRAGRAIFDAAAQRPEPIPVYAEMGSVNPVFVLPGAARTQAKQIAEALGGSITLSAGQFCTNPGLLIGEDAALRDVRERIGELISQTAPASLLNPGIRDNYEKGSQRLLSVANVTAAAQSTTAADATKTQAAARLFATDAKTFLANHALGEEVFGPSSVLVNCSSKEDLEAIAHSLAGQLTATVFATEEDIKEYAKLISILRSKVGRLICNSPPTGVEVCPSMNHGGPYPATTDVRSTSVGTAAIDRFARPICYQGFPQSALPPELQNPNPRGLWRLVNGKLTKDSVG